MVYRGMPGDEKNVLIRNHAEIIRFNYPGADIPGMLDIPFTIKKIPAMTVIGISRRTSNAEGRSLKDMMAAWTDFLQQNAAAKIKNRALPPTIYAIYSDYENDWRGTYSYLIGYGVTRAGTIPEGMEVRQIPAQTCAVFTAKGQMPDEILAIWSMIWLSELPRTYTFDFEIYDKRFMNPTQKEVDVCVAIDPYRMEQREPGSQ
jgi:predicted transcriptional regulator YdeE